MGELAFRRDGFSLATLDHIAFCQLINKQAKRGFEPRNRMATKVDLGRASGSVIDQGEPDTCGLRKYTSSVPMPPKLTLAEL